MRRQRIGAAPGGGVRPILILALWELGIQALASLARGRSAISKDEGVVSYLFPTSEAGHVRARNVSMSKASLSGPDLGKAG